PKQTRYPDGTTETYEYGANGDLVSITDRRGKTTTIVSTTVPGGGRQRVLTRQVEVYSSTSSTPDLNNVLNITTEVYDAHGNLVKMTEEGGGAAARTTTYVYDWANRRTKTLYPGGGSSEVVYGPQGVIAQTIERPTDASAPRTTSYLYDANRHLTQMTH